MGLLILVQDSRRSRKLRASYFSSKGARGDLHLRIISNALGLAHIAAGHDVKLVIVFAKPNRRSHRSAAFAKRGKRDVFLTANSCWNGVRHCFHFSLNKLPDVVRLRAGLIDPVLGSVLKAIHAQMDA